MHRVLLVAILLGAAAIARAACDPHPMEQFELYPNRSANPLPGLESCVLRAETTTTATLRCNERVYHMTLAAS